jgi:signal transduction histidine kinase
VEVSSTLEWRDQLISETTLFHDRSGSLSVDQISALPNRSDGFIEVKQLDNPGMADGMPWWAKVELKNSSHLPYRLRLILNPGSTFRAATFFDDRDGKWQKTLSRESGQDSLDFVTASRFKSVPISLEAGESVTLLIRTVGVAPIHLAPYLYTEHVFNEFLTRSTIWDGLLFGGLLSLAWTAWMLGFFARSRSFLLLGFLSFVTLMTEALRRGYGNAYFEPDFAEWVYRGPLILGNLTILLVVLFVIEVARVEKVKLPLRKLLLGWSVYNAAVVMLAAFGDVYTAQWLTQHVRPFLSLTLLIVALLFLRANTPTRKIMFGIAIFSLARVALIALESDGVLPDYIANLTVGTLRTNPVIALGSLLVNLTLLAAWVAHVGAQRKRALDEIARLQLEENHRLAAEVSRQTIALHKALDYAEEKNRQQTQIVGYISHDLRAPLATISGYTKLIERTASDMQKPHLDAVTRSVDYQMALIEDILGYATSELKPLSLRPELTSMAEYLDEITQHANALSHQQNNRFVIRVPAPLPKRVWIDGRRLRQVLLNLLSNAAKFTRNGIIRLDLLATPLERDWQFRFVTSDSGPGIDAHLQEEIFHEYSQIDASKGGVGLGLYIAKTIVSGMGSELKLHSEAGLGSQFSFDLSISSADDQIFRWSPPETLPSPSSRFDGRPLNGHYGEATDGAEIAERSAGSLLPLQELQVLERLAKDGEITDIERWLNAMHSKHPGAASYLLLIQKELHRLNFSEIERLALGL